MFLIGGKILSWRRRSMSQVHAAPEVATPIYLFFRHAINCVTKDFLLFA
jgi:hypothetical protein